MMNSGLEFKFPHAIKILFQYLAMNQITPVRELLESTRPLGGTEHTHLAALQALRDLEKARASVLELERKLEQQHQQRQIASNN